MTNFRASCVNWGQTPIPSKGDRGSVRAHPISGQRQGLRGPATRIVQDIAKQTATVVLYDRWAKLVS